MVKSNTVKSQTSVSYTHLDVYKRQAETTLSRILEFAWKITLEYLLQLSRLYYVSISKNKTLLHRPNI